MAERVTIDLTPSVGRRARQIRSARLAAAAREEARQSERRAQYYRSAAGAARDQAREMAERAGAWEGVALALRTELNIRTRRRKDRQAIAELWERLTAGLK